MTRHSTFATDERRWTACAIEFADDPAELPSAPNLLVRSTGVGIVPAFVFDGRVVLEALIRLSRMG
jgi:hypothetical protein